MQYFFTALFASLLLSVSVQATPSRVRAADEDNVARAPSPLPSAFTYNIDCNSFPNVCQNQCYYVNCKQGGQQSAWEVHVQRTPASRPHSECAGYNRCSHGRKSGPIPGGWAYNPHSDWSCDEQPKSSVLEGGAGSATRCMPRGENSAEGAAWSNFINGNTPATGNTRIADGTGVIVALLNSNNAGYCAGTHACHGATTPPATNNGPRQR